MKENCSFQSSTPPGVDAGRVSQNISALDSGESGLGFELLSGHCILLWAIIVTLTLLFYTQVYKWMTPINKCSILRGGGGGKE